MQENHHAVWLILLHPSHRAVTRGGVAWLANPPARAGAHDIDTSFGWETRSDGCVTSFETRRAFGAHQFLCHMAFASYDSGQGIGVGFGSNRQRQREAASLETYTSQSGYFMLTVWAVATGSTAYFSSAERPQTIMQLATKNSPKETTTNSPTLRGYQGKNRQPARAAHAVTSQAKGGSRYGTGNRPNICAQTAAH